MREHWFLTAFPQYLAPFRQSEPSLKVFLVYDSDKEQCRFCEKDEEGIPADREKALGITRIQLSAIAKARLWLWRDFESSIHKLANEQEKSPHTISLRYGELTFSHRTNSLYEYNDQLGMVTI